MGSAVLILMFQPENLNGLSIYNLQPLVSTMCFSRLWVLNSLPLRTRVKRIPGKVCKHRWVQNQMLDEQRAVSQEDYSSGPLSWSSPLAESFAWPCKICHKFSIIQTFNKLYVLILTFEYSSIRWRHFSVYLAHLHKWWRNISSLCSTHIFAWQWAKCSAYYNKLLEMQLHSTLHPVI